MAIIVNLVLIILQTDVEATEGEPIFWVDILNRVLILMFLVELGWKLCMKRRCFWSKSGQLFTWEPCSEIFWAAVKFHVPWPCWSDLNWFNIVDFVVVVIDLLLELVELYSWAAKPSPGLSFIRILRLARVARARRVLANFPMLSGMCRDMLGAMQAVCSGLILLIVNLIIWSVIAVQFVNPLMQDMVAENKFDGCERCARAFGSVTEAFVTFWQQIVAGDSWGAVSIPVMEAHPWTAVIFIAVQVNIQLGLLNVILAVIVQAAEETRKSDLIDQMKIKEQHFYEKSKVLLRICRDLDTDGSGDLSFEELMRGFEEHRELGGILHDLGIKREDLATVFEIMDGDHSGNIDYREFIQQIYNMKTADELTVLQFIRHYVMQILRQVNRNQGTALRTGGSNLSDASSQPLDGISSMPVVLGRVPSKAGRDQVAATPGTPIARAASNSLDSSFADALRKISRPQSVAHAHTDCDGKTGSAIDVQTSFESIRTQIETIQRELMQVLKDADKRFNQTTLSLLETARRSQAAPAPVTPRVGHSHSEIAESNSSDDCDVSENATPGELNPITAARHTSLSRNARGRTPCHSRIRG
jgi:Ca2+-binding EF-hand superfamily protein